MASDSAMQRAPAAGQTERDLCVFIVAGEHSGDALGAKLMAALNAQRRGRLRFIGVGGELMSREGLVSQFPMHEVAVMGIGAILMRLPRLLRRVYGTVSAAVAAQPDVVVIIDSPEFTHPIAKRIRRRLPDVPIIDYVSPSVWAWRPGRAKKMAAYIDHVMGLLPFEPAAHARLGGPPCSYVGHPLTERLSWLAALDTGPLLERVGIAPDMPVLVVLPGSRGSEVRRLMQPFGEAIGRLVELGAEFEVLVPVVDSVRALVEAESARWAKRPHLVSGEDDKFRAFKAARAALAASGTVTLELALAGAPMIVAYKVEPVMAPLLRRLITAESVVLVNLILGERAIPELLQEYCTPANIASALVPLLQGTPTRAKQMAALARVPRALQLPGDGTPSEAAAAIVLHYAQAGRTAAA